MLESIKGANGKILLAALAGTTAGIITGLLMAPETGQETRKGLARQVNDLGSILSKPFRKYFGKPIVKKGPKSKKKALNNQ